MNDYPEKLTGGCLCGAVRYETTMKPFKVCYCHCESCRRATGSVMASSAGITLVIRCCDWSG